MPRDWKEDKNPKYVDIQKEDLKERIVEGLTSRELANHFNVSQNTITNKVDKFWGEGLRSVRKKLYRENHKYGSCKVCGEPLKATQSVYCSNECKFSDEEYNRSRASSQKNDEDKKAVCKLCGYESDDYKNVAGSLTKHINRKHSNEGVDGVFKIKEKDEVEYLECPECDWKTEDIKNESGSFTKHIQKNHQDILSFYRDHSEFKSILPIDKVKRKRRLDENGVECKICGENFDKLTNTHLKKHNITPTEYKINYESETYSEDHYDKCKEHYEEHLEGNEHIYISQGEKEIKEFLEEIGIENIESSVRYLEGVSEVDILLPEFDIAIEYNGLRYHSEDFNNKGKWFHWNKNEKCEENGIDLIQIFSDQWNYKKEIVKSRLKYKIGMGDGNRLGARECKVVEINNTQKRKFLNDNHIRGTVNSSVALGLKNDNKLVAIMTFGHSRSQYGYELSRFAIKKNTVVYGAAGKLFSNFKKNMDPNSVVTYVDLAWSSKDDNFYSKIGFEFDGEVDPSYFYTKNYHRRIHKSNFSKSNIKRKYPDKFDENLTEWGNMKKLGFDRVWDCGKLRYIWNK